jgi:predicted ATPase/class 3 adenylate cyclase
LDSFTFLFTDVEDSTAVWEREPDAMQTAIARHDAVMSATIERSGCRVYKAMGDGVCAVFEQPRGALQAALRIQHALATESWPTAEPLRARIAIASGEASLRTGDYFGPAVNLVARLLSLCRGGQTLLCADVAPSIGDGSLQGAEVHRHGWYRLKGIDEPVEVAELSAGAVSAPPHDGEKAYRVVRIGDRWCPLRDIPNNLAPDRDLFIGREAALRELAQRLERKSRLVTVLGPGGIGKTRLAQRYAADWLGDWPGGVYFCDLSEARSVEGIHYAVSVALGVPLGREDAAVQLGHAIAARGACLVILDNFEQVQAHAAATVGRWLDQAPGARFIVTSRERLHLAGEDVLALEPMDLSHDALSLFAVRARAQRPGFAIDEDNRAVVHEIVRLLDGLPLAIELAAARVRVLSPAQIVMRMQDRFALLAGTRGVAARQATLRAAIDWSWALLASWEQRALAQCSIFDGGFSLEAAEAVLALPAGAPPVIDVVQGLVDKSLLRTRVFNSPRLDIAEPYFGMYMSIHEYASDRLRELGERSHADVELRHGRYFARFGADAAIDALKTHGGIARRHRMAVELDNLVVACRRAIARADPETASACFRAAFAVLEAQGPFALAETLGRGVAEMAGIAGGRRARVLTALSHAMFGSGRPGPTNDVLREALAAAREGRDRRAEVDALRQLAIARHITGLREESEECFRAALALCGGDDGAQRAILLSNLANLQMELGRMADAQASYHASLDLLRATGNRSAEGIALGNLGTLHHDLGQLEEARAAYEAALEIHRDAGSLLQQAITLGNLGLLVIQQGNREQASELYRTALSIHRGIGNRRGIGVILKQMGELEHALGDLAGAEARYDEALAIFRDIGNRRFQGGVFGDIAEVMIDRARPQAAVDFAEQGERIFREIDDPMSLAEILTTKGRALTGLGDGAAARAVLLEAEAIATRLGAKAGSELQRRVGLLRDALR